MTNSIPLASARPNVRGARATTLSAYQWVGAIPFILVHVAPLLAFWTGTRWKDWAVCAALYWIRMFGVTGVYHRYFSHRTYKTSRFFQFLLALLAMSSSQKGVLWWASNHRVHHRLSDQDGDPHDSRRGFWYSHMGWLYDHTKATDYGKVKDLARYPELVFLNELWFLPPALLGITVWLALGWSGLLIGFFLSTVLLWHGTFAINSLSHMLGTQRYDAKDDSTNNWVLAIITMGEGWHNNHHHFMGSTRQGFYWWEIDVSYYILRGLQALGLVWDIKEPPASVYDISQQRAGARTFCSQDPVSQSPRAEAESGVTRTKLHGSNPDAVISAIRARHVRLRYGGCRNDGRKLGLVIEGGGLRGVSSAGGVVALAQLGFSDVFDEVYATSAAVMNASYFITNQPLLGISVYFDNCTTRQFVNPWRFWKVIDVDYIFDHVAVHEKKLDMSRLLASPSRLYVAVIDRNTGEGFMVNVRTAGVPPLQALKASAAIPVFYNRSVFINGRQCIDGGLAIPFGVKQALANGCTDILVLTTRPVGYISSRPSWFDRAMFNLVCARGSAPMNRVFAEWHLRSREATELSLGQQPVPSGVSIATLCADESENVELMTTDRRRLHTAAVSCGRKVLSVFGHRSAATWTLPEDCAAAGFATSPEPLLPM